MDAAASGAVAEPPAWVPGESDTARVESLSSDDQPVHDSPDIGLGDPNEEPRKGSPERGYVVLEECDLAELVAHELRANGVEETLTQEQVDALRGLDVFQALGSVESKNAENALRRAAKDHYAHSATPTLRAVPHRNWRPTTVTVRTDTHVSLG